MKKNNTISPAAVGAVYSAPKVRTVTLSVHGILCQSDAAINAAASEEDDIFGGEDTILEALSN